MRKAKKAVKNPVKNTSKTVSGLITSGEKKLSAIKSINLNPFKMNPLEQFRWPKSPAAKQAAVILGAFTAGATLAYFLDPDSGKKRRSAVVDRANGLSNGLMEATTKQWSDLSGRVSDVLSKGFSGIKENIMSVINDTSETPIDRAAEYGASSSSSARTQRKDYQNGAFKGTQESPFPKQ